MKRLALALVLALLPGCKAFDNAVKHLPPGRYEIGGYYQDASGRIVGGTASYTRDDWESEQGATLRATDPLDTAMRGLPTTLRVRKIPDATTAAVTTRN